MALSVACPASLLTPIATPVNLIAMGAAGHRFGWSLEAGHHRGGGLLRRGGVRRADVLAVL